MEPGVSRLSTSISRRGTIGNKFMEGVVVTVVVGWFSIAWRNSKASRRIVWQRQWTGCSDWDIVSFFDTVVNPTPTRRPRNINRGRRVVVVEELVIAAAAREG